MLNRKIHPRIFAWLSFCLSLLFFLLIFSEVFIIKYLVRRGNDALLNRLLSTIALSFLASMVLSLVFGIIAFWKGNREMLSGTEKRLARGGLLISGVFFLCFVPGFFLPRRAKTPVAIYCTNELKTACIALAIYHLDHKVFPAPSEWEEVVDGEVPKETRKKDLATLERECPGHHYVYFWPKVPDSNLKNHHIPLLADAEPYHKGKHLVVFVDGKVEPLTPEELKALIPK